MVVVVQGRSRKRLSMIFKKWILACIFVACAFVLLGSSEKRETLTRPQGKPEEECRIQNCHGLDIQCGLSQPMACTAMYQLGDFCRQFAECRMVEGKCHFISNDIFMQCKNCIQDCELNKAEINPFVCEVKCRKQFDPNFYQPSQKTTGMPGDQ